MAIEPGSSNIPRKTGLCAGLCFASAVGLSVYVTFTFAIFLAIWGMIVLVRGPAPERAAWVVAGVVALALAVPYLRATGGAGGAGGPFVIAAVRSFAPFEVLPYLGFGQTRIAVANLLVLPLNYFPYRRSMVRAGDRLVEARLASPMRHLGQAELGALAMFAVSLLVSVSSFRGDSANDLGRRSLLILVDLTRLVDRTPPCMVAAPLAAVPRPQALAEANERLDRARLGNQRL